MLVFIFTIKKESVLRGQQGNQTAEPASCGEPPRTPHSTSKIPEPSELHARSGDRWALVARGAMSLAQLYQARSAEGEPLKLQLKAYIETGVRMATSTLRPIS